MFGLFRKKVVRRTVAPNAVYVSRKMADEALVQTVLASAYPVVAVSFFPDSLSWIGRALEDAQMPATEVSSCSSANEFLAPSPLLLNARRATDAVGFEAALLGADTEFLFVFVERFPLHSVSEQFLDRLERVAVTRMQRVIFFTGLDEPLMSVFGGERLIQLMERLGMDPTERISHDMVDQSIENACRRIEKQVRRPMPADSDAEWFSRHFPGG